MHSGLHFVIQGRSTQGSKTFNGEVDPVVNQIEKMNFKLDRTKMYCTKILSFTLKIFNQCHQCVEVDISEEYLEVALIDVTKGLD